VASHSSSLPTLSTLLIALLSLSILFSEAPVFSAFKVYQLAVTFAFVMLFTRRFGINETLNNLFLGCAALTLTDIVAAFVMPDLVFVESEIGSMRFRGDLIAQTGCVSIIGPDSVTDCEERSFQEEVHFVGNNIQQRTCFLADAHELPDSAAGISAGCAQTSGNTRVATSGHNSHAGFAFCSGYVNHGLKRRAKGGRHLDA
jgi:hypothetical protein